MPIFSYWFENPYKWKKTVNNTLCLAERLTQRCHTTLLRRPATSIFYSFRYKGLFTHFLRLFILTYTASKKSHKGFSHSTLKYRPE